MTTEPHRSVLAADTFAQRDRMTATLDPDAQHDGHRRPDSGTRARRWPSITSISVVIPALDEEENIPHVLGMIPRAELIAAGCALEIIVVDNLSMDRTGEVATSLGAKVVLQAARGYGNAYHAGLAAACGDVVVTGDADCSYPFDAVPRLLDQMVAGDVDFLSTNRLRWASRRAMKRSHAMGNRVLTATSRRLFRAPFRDSQSGMWVFRRRIWSHLDVRSGGMQFSQEIKNEAWLKGFRCAEVPITYLPRVGVVKLNAFRDGTRNVGQLMGHRFRANRRLVAVRLLSNARTATSLRGSCRPRTSCRPRPSRGSDVFARDDGLRQAERVLRPYRIWLGIVLLLAGGLSALASSPAGRHQLALSFTREPAPYVALAFDPVPVTQSGPNVAVAFTVTAHDGDSAALPYQVDVADSAGVRVTAVGQTRPASSDGDLHERVGLTLAPGRSWRRVDVGLVGRPETIHLRSDPGEAPSCPRRRPRRRTCPWCTSAPTTRRGSAGWSGSPRSWRNCCPAATTSRSSPRTSARGAPAGRPSGRRCASRGSPPWRSHTRRCRRDWSGACSACRGG